jgi:hypothetical protein
VSWGTIALGILLWLIAVGWSLLTLRAADDDRCKRPSSSLCRRIIPHSDEPDPLDEADRARQP